MNVLLLEDHPIFRFGVRQLIMTRWPDASITETGTLTAALAAVRQVDFRVAVIDLNLPDSDGIEAVAKLHRAAPAMKILVLSLNAEAAYAQRALQLGAAGYLAKDRAGEELLLALEKIGSGGRYITQSLAEQLAGLLTGERAGGSHESLSAQEYRVMIQLAEGHQINAIAVGMNLSPKTVSTYRSRILEKLGLGSNAELARYCVAHQLIAPRS